ncbi:MAG: hypothetical protein ACI9Y1_002554 [Lentisphaeria bacterium]
MDIQFASIGGHNIGWTSPEEWLEYTISVTDAASYNIRALIASDSSGGTIHVEFSGVSSTQTNSISFSGTGG